MPRPDWYSFLEKFIKILFVSTKTKMLVTLDLSLTALASSFRTEYWWEIQSLTCDVPERGLKCGDLANVSV